MPKSELYIQKNTSNKSGKKCYKNHLKSRLYVNKMLKKQKTKYRYDEEFDMWESTYDYDYDVVNHKLGTLADYYKIPFPNKHRSAGDAIVTGKLFLHLIKDKKEILEARQKKQTNSSSNIN